MGICLIPPYPANEKLENEIETLPSPSIHEYF